MRKLGAFQGAIVQRVAHHYSEELKRLGSFSLKYKDTQQQAEANSVGGDNYLRTILLQDSEIKPGAWNGRSLSGLYAGAGLVPWRLLAPHRA
jgi:hypothetical protein